MSLHQRLRDWRLERLIKLHSDACMACMELGDTAEARHHWHAFTAAVRRRSPQQIARMERRAGLVDSKARKTLTGGIE